jgi:alpha-N-arabinofuranosidase
MGNAGGRRRCASAPRSHSAGYYYSGDSATSWGIDPSDHLNLARTPSAGAWDNAFINFDHTGWFPAPNYVVMKLWWDNFAPQMLSFNGDQQGCNIVATRSEDGRLVVVKAVNPGERDVSVEVELTGEFGLKTASMEIVAPGSLRARNTLDEPTAVKSDVGVVNIMGQSLTFDLPAYSAAVVRVN